MVNNEYIISGVVLSGIIIALILIPSLQTDQTIIIEDSGAGNFTDTTECINMASQYQIVVNSTDGDCFIRSLANGNNIVMSTNGTHIIINSTASGESTVCTNLGSVGEGIYASGNCNFKKLLAGTGISLSSNGTRITITNTSPESTNCNNVGTGVVIHVTSSNCNAKSLIAGAGVTITDTTDDYTFASVITCNNTGTGLTLCSPTNPGSNLLDIKSLIGSNGITITDTTGDLTFTPKYEFLCQVTSVASVESFSCSSLPDRNHYFVTFEGRVTGGAITPAMQFNGDTATNYAHRFSLNGAADTTSTNRGNCVIGSGWADTDRTYVEFSVFNNQAGDRKGWIGQTIEDFDTADTTAPTKIETSCKWDNTASVINRIDIICSGGCGATARYATGSVFTVWGYD